MKYLKTHDEKCIGCNRCMSVCSMTFFKEDNFAKSAIQVRPKEEGGYQLIVCNQSYRNCVAECPTQAISINKLGVVLINKKLCINCLSCVAACPINAMMHFPGGLYPFKCVACGACVKECPTQALEIVQEESA
ncbi:MAG: 4Fe-4S binding protein [Acidobacteria bacterium]|nr:4Fe-4S binding protein [Acidobacteriota bacterium]